MTAAPSTEPRASFPAWIVPPEDLDTPVEIGGRQFRWNADQREAILKPMRNLGLAPSDEREFLDSVRIQIIHHIVAHEIKDLGSRVFSDTRDDLDSALLEIKKSCDRLVKSFLKTMSRLLLGSKVLNGVIDISTLEQGFAQTLDQINKLKAVVEKERGLLAQRRGRRRTYALPFFIGSLAVLYLRWTGCDPRDGLSEAHDGRGAFFHGPFYDFVVACVEATGVHRAAPTGLGRKIPKILKADIIFQRGLRQFQREQQFYDLQELDDF